MSGVLRFVTRALGPALGVSLVGCGALFPSRGSSELPATPPADPTPLAKCHISANAESPLVTEWPASEKAHLQSLSSARTVAVAYSGCDLRIVDGCALTGGYDFRRTTLATDSVEIEDADELYAKLPIGAVGLEGELSRSGRLAVRSTVVGLLQSRALDAGELSQPGCQDATHYVSAISIGAFQLLSGAGAEAGGGVTLAGAGAGAHASRREVVLREAGSREACSETTDAAPTSQCASPIQVFLTPLPARHGASAVPALADPNLAAAIRISFPGPPDDEVWTLRAPQGHVICTLPCEASVGPVSGDYLQREPRNGFSTALLRLPQSFPHRVGSRVTAEYRAERGNPTLARWALFGAIPFGVSGVGLTTWGIVQAASTCERDATGREDCFPPAGFLLGTGIFLLATSGAGLWWHVYSHEEAFNTYERLDGDHAALVPGLHIGVGPTGLLGTF